MGADRPIFVLGCPRSGTTLLQLMLHSHHRIAIPPETRFVISTYQSRGDFGDLRDPARLRALAESIVGRRQTLFYDLGLDPKQMVEEIVAGPPTLGSVFGAVFRAYVRRFGKPRWGDKRPGYYAFIPALARLFPSAQFVHLVRDGRDCVASLKAMPWFNHDIYAAVATWMEATGRGRRAGAALPAGSYWELRYEDLVADPAGQLRALCDFLGEEYDPAMSDPRGTAESVIPKRKTWHDDTRRQVEANPSGPWSQRLEPWEISLCETVMGRRLRALGYELSGSGRAPAANQARFATVAALGQAAARKREARDWVQRMRDPVPLECRL